MEAVQLPNDSVSIRTGKSDQKATAFLTQRVSADAIQQYLKSTAVDSMTVTVPDTVSVEVVADPGFNYDKKILLAAFGVLSKSSPHILNIDTATANNATNTKASWIVWLSKKPAPSFTSHTISFQDHAQGDLKLFQRRAATDIKYSSWNLTKRLTEDTAIKYNLSAQLALILLPTPKQLARLQTYDKRVLPEKIAWPAQRLTALELNETVKAVSAEKLFTVLFFITLLFERFLAYKRNQ
jgi:hypothetical protein